LRTARRKRMPSDTANQHQNATMRMPLMRVHRHAQRRDQGFRQWSVDNGCDYGHTMLDLDDLTMSLAGLRDDPFTCGPEDLERIVQASASAGFRGVSIWSIHAEQLAAEGYNARAVARLCADHGLQVRMVEAVTAWPAADRAAIDEETRAVFALSVELGAEEVLAATLGNGALDLEVAAKGFAYTCDLAARFGLRVGLEFLPWSSVPDLRTACEVVERADRDNGGLIIDSWHWQRQPGGPDFDTLRMVRADRIHVLQLNDAPQQPDGDILDETMNRRLLPGEGEIDLRSLIDVIDELGAEPMVAPEVFSRKIGALDPEHAARLVSDATRRVLAG
jgi:sugar phosphate isomerase/epimerase